MNKAIKNTIKGIGYAGAFCIVIYGTEALLSWLEDPINVYVRDVNGDGAQDVIVKSRFDPNFIFLQQGVNNFKRFEDYQREQLGTVSKSQTEERKAVESKLAEIVKNAESREQ